MFEKVGVKFIGDLFERGAVTLGAFDHGSHDMLKGYEHVC